MSKLNIITIGDVDNVIAMFGLTGKINSVTTSYYNENTGHSILSIFGCKRNTRGILSVKLVVENHFREINQDMTFDIEDQAFANKCIVNLKNQIEKHNQSFDEFNITKDFENMELPPLISMPHDEFKNNEKMVQCECGDMCDGDNEADGSNGSGSDADNADNADNNRSDAAD